MQGRGDQGNARKPNAAFENLQVRVPCGLRQIHHQGRRRGHTRLPQDVPRWARLDESLARAAHHRHTHRFGPCACVRFAEFTRLPLLTVWPRGPPRTDREGRLKSLSETVYGCPCVRAPLLGPCVVQLGSFAPLMGTIHGIRKGLSRGTHRHVSRPCPGAATKATSR